MKQLLPLAAGLLLTLNATQVQAQHTLYQGLPIAYWDFEKNNDRTQLETTVDQQINPGNEFLGKLGGYDVAVYAEYGAAKTSNYNGSVEGRAIQSFGWQTATVDPDLNANTFFEFKLNTTGFTGITFGLDFASGGSNWPYVGINYSSNGGVTWSNLGNFGNITKGQWYCINSVTFGNDLDDKSDVRVRIYGFDGANNNTSWLRLENVQVLATGMVSGAGTKVSLDERNIYTSYTSGKINSLWNRYGTFTIPNGATLDLGGQIGLGNPGAIAVQNGGTLDCGSNEYFNITGSTGTSVIVNSGATLIIRSPEGIASSGTLGNIRTNTRTFNNGAHYVYRQPATGGGAQITGTGLPATQSGSLTIDNPAEVTLTRNTTITGALNLAQGHFINGDYLTLNNTKVTRNMGVLQSAPTFTGSNYAVTYSGIAAVTAGYELPVSPATLATLTMAKTGGVTLSHDLIIANGMVFNQGIITAGAYHVVLNGSLTGGNATSYFRTNSTGTLSRNVGMLPVVFPVGNSTYNPATLLNTGTPDHFYARVADGVYENGFDGTSVNSSNTHVVNRTWHISELIPGGSSLIMQLQWNAGEENHVNFDKNHVYLAHHNGTKWEPLFTEDLTQSPAATGANPYYTSQANVSSFSPFTVASGSAPMPLPVVLMDITASNEGDRNRVDWHSGKEANVSHYEVEKSRDGNTFSYLSATKAENQPFGYITYDNTPFEGLTYYRLKMADKDGSFAYSKVVSAFMKGRHGFAMTAFPNPATEKVTVKVEGGMEGAAVQLTDLSGRVLSQQRVENGKAQFDVRSLAQGVYFIKYADGQRTETIKVNKQ